MGIEKTILTEGNGVDYPKKGDVVSMEYTGWLYAPDKPDTKGNE
jgi:FK506-binding protein 1